MSWVLIRSLHQANTLKEGNGFGWVSSGDNEKREVVSLSIVFITLLVAWF